MPRPQPPCVYPKRKRKAKTKSEIIQKFKLVWNSMPRIDDVTRMAEFKQTGNDYRLKERRRTKYVPYLHRSSDQLQCYTNTNKSKNLCAG